MSLGAQAEAFLANKRVAVVGVSRSGGTGNGILHKLLDQGYEVFPVNPNVTELEGLTCYPSVSAIPGGVQAAVVVTKPEVTEKVVRDCAQAGVSHVWMHYNAMFGAGNSSVSDEAVAFCRDNGIDVIPGACPMMYVEGADFGHKCMRWILGVTNKLPKVDVLEQTEQATRLQRGGGGPEVRVTSQGGEIVLRPTGGKTLFGVPLGRE